MGWPYFIWKDTNSTDMGIAVNTYPPIVKPRERISQVTIPGRQGDLAIPESNGEPIYEAYLRTVECTLLPDAQLQNVLSWLTGTGSVIFGNEPGMVYTARIVNQISFDKIMRGREHRSFSVPFYCQPLKAAAETEEPVALTASGQRVWNPGDVIAHPKFTVSGSGTGSFSVSAQEEACTLVFGQDSALILDSDAMLCVNVQGANRCSRMTGDYPLLAPGWNTVTWEGGITGIRIEGRWRWL